MSNELDIKLKGLILVTGPTRSGKSIWAERLIARHTDVTYIATSKERPTDKEWIKRVNIHKQRRPKEWRFKLYENNKKDWSKLFNRKHSVLIDSLGGIIEQHIDDSSLEWEKYVNESISFLRSNDQLIIIVIEETGWGIVPSTPLGNLFRERITSYSLLLSQIAIQNWLVVNNHAINISNMGISIK